MGVLSFSKIATSGAMLVVAIIAASSFGYAANAPILDPLAPARTGALACIRPDSTKKHCNTIIRYEFVADGSIISHLDVTMGDSVVMSTITPARINGDVVCSDGREEDVRRATFRVSDRPATAEETNDIRDYLASNIRTRGGSENCVRFVQRSDGMFMEVVVSGVRHSELDEPMAWAPSDDGYTAHP